jgi:hypothetical protein
VVGTVSRCIFGLASAVALLGAACGSDGSGSATSATGAARGESCERHSDCAEGLACVNQVCVLDHSGLAPTGKECVAIECATPTDCCPEPPPSCPSLEAYCNSGDSNACQQYQQYCTCQPERWSCENDQCVELCQTSVDCQLGTCVGTRCVECGSNDDCPSSMACKAQKCVPKCTSSAECPYFNQCVAGTCMETGCSLDRECVAATGNVLAVCRAGECDVPCDSDFQCKGSTSAILACINGVCVDVGCESDEECRLLLGVQAGKGFEAVCRPVAPPAGG